MYYHAKAVVVAENSGGIMLQIISKTVFAFILLLLPTFVFAEVDALAVKSADTFLKGVKLIQLPEGKKMIADTAWRSSKSYPVYTEASTLFEDMFQTDNPSIKGFKRLMEIKVVSKGGTPLLKQYILIAYKDPITNLWKIYDFRESEDTEHEAQSACKNPGTLSALEQEVFNGAKKLGLPITPDVERHYHNCGYWSTMSGNLFQAKGAFMKGSELRQQRTDNGGIPQSVFDEQVNTLKKILGE